MSNNDSTIPLLIRKVVFDKFNDTNLRFTNDEIFDVLQNSGMDKSLTIDDLEPFFNQLRDDGLIRQIAQNFTTRWYKLFDIVEQTQCKSCGQIICLGKLEPRVCPNVQCKASI